MDSFDEANDRWEYWKALFVRIVDSNIPLRKVRVKSDSLPWISSEIRVLMRARNYLCTKAKSSRRDEDWERYRKLKNQLTMRIRQAKIQHFEQLSEQTKQNPRKLWTELNKALGRKSKQKIDSLTTHQGILTQQQDIVEEFNCFFSASVGNLDDTEVDPDCGVLPEKLAGSAGEFDLLKTEEEDVLMMLRTLDTTKAAGVDGISARVLKMAAPGISHSLTSLFNFCLESGQLPDEWKHAKVTPVPKVSMPDTADKFRPISVLPVVAKMFERIVHHHVSAYLQEHSLLHESQSGFRPHHSTQDVLVSTVEDWRQEVDRDKLVGTIMVDLSKAFDIVDHSILLQKLEGYGIRGNALKLFANYLDGRKQRVVIGSAMSEWSNIRRGVPQGSILGPLLFTIYVNDLPLAVKRCTVKQYADDTALYCSSNSPASLEQDLTSDIAAVSN